jgi:hypothetical protein
MKTKGYKLILIMMVGLFALSACQYMPVVSTKELNASYVRKIEAEAKIAALERQHVVSLTENEKKLSETKDKVINGQDTQLQAGADALYSIQQVTALPPQPGTLEFTRVRSVEGFTAMGKPPSIKEIIEGGERLRKYLTTYQTNDPAELEKLRVEHARLVKENANLVVTTEVAKKEVVSVKEEKLAIEQKYIKDTAAAQTDLNKANDKVIDKERERAEQERIAKEKAEDWKAAIRQIQLWCGIGAAVALVGAVYSPIGKGGLASIAGVLALTTIALAFIKPWMIWILLGVVIIVIGVAVAMWLRKHNLAEVANDNMVNAIEDTTTKEGSTITDLKTNLKEWNTKYVKDKTGNIVTKTDEQVERYIKEKLAKNGRLVPKK